MIKAQNHNKDYAAGLGLVLCTVYQSYRYPLQINTVGFSPTYSETPLIWQAGKYVFALPLIAVSVIRWLAFKKITDDDREPARSQTTGIRRVPAEGEW